MKSWNIIFLFFLILGCSHSPNIKKIYPLEFPPVIGQVPGVGNLYLGGLSGLWADETLQHHFYVLTDRGPNGGLISKGDLQVRPFLLPQFQPQIIQLAFTKNTIVIEKQIAINASGLPNDKQLDEVPVDVNGNLLPTDPNGIDPEGIIKDSSGNFWVVEEYGPSLLKISQDGNILKKFIPDQSPTSRLGERKLSAFLKDRKPNRGFEGITLIGEKIYLILQSPLPISQASVPIIEFDITKELQTGIFIYPLDDQHNKIGDLSRDQFGNIFVLEQNGIVGKECSRKLYKIRPISRFNVFQSIAKHNLDGNVLPKKMEYDLNIPELNNEEKIEGVAYLSEKELLVVADNDFGIATLIDKNTGRLNKMGDIQSHFYLIEKK